MNYVRWMPVCLAAGLLACACPSVAGAADYCVETLPACGTKNVATFQDALDSAAATEEADRIYLGGETYTAPAATGFVYDRPDRPVEIIGNGRGGPEGSTLTGQPGGSGWVLRLIGGPGTSITNLRIHQPPNAAAGSGALRTNGTARNLTVEANPAEQTQSSRVGVSLVGGTVEDALVGVGQYGTVGVSFDDGGGTIRHSDVDGDIGVESKHGGSIERTHMNTTNYGLAATGGTTTIQSSWINAQGSFGAGIAAFVLPGSDTSLIADGLTLIGPKTANAIGVEASTAHAPDQSPRVTLKNSIVRDFAVDLGAGSSGQGIASIDASYSDYDPSKVMTAPGPAIITQANISNAGDAGFTEVDEDWIVPPGSPLIDAGDPVTAQGLDFRGNPLVTDGDHDGVARRDIGAIEVPGPLPAGPPADPPVGPPVGGGGGTGDQGPAGDHQAPVLSRLSATSARRSRLRYTLSEPARVTIAIQRVVRRGGRIRYRTIGRLTRDAGQGLNRARLPRRIGSRVLRPGRYRVVARATDAAGNRSAARRAAFRLLAS
jgi:hypothetical protein